METGFVHLIEALGRVAGFRVLLAKHVLTTLMAVVLVLQSHRILPLFFPTGFTNDSATPFAMSSIPMCFSGQQFFIVHVIKRAIAPLCCSPWAHGFQYGGGFGVRGPLALQVLGRPGGCSKVPFIEPKLPPALHPHCHRRTKLRLHSVREY